MYNPHQVPPDPLDKFTKLLLSWTYILNDHCIFNRVSSRCGAGIQQNGTFYVLFY